MEMIDAHVHLMETPAVGRWVLDNTDIWEYGTSEKEIPGSRRLGNLEDLESAMLAAGVAYCVVLNSFSIDEWLGRRASGLESAIMESLVPVESPLASWLIGFNQWLTSAVADRHRLIPFVGIDPFVLSPGMLRTHLREMKAAGAAGVKLHTVEQRASLDDPLMEEVLRQGQDLDLPIVLHGGCSRRGAPSAKPSNLQRPRWATSRLRLVLAHLGGAAWREAPTLAEHWPEVVFDISEIIAWLGAEHGPSAQQLMELIREIGVDRVLFGSDFPWYEPSEMAERVGALPGMGPFELEAIMSANAARLLGFSD